MASIFDNLTWYPSQVFRHKEIPKNLLESILYKGSLTKQLRKSCQNFQVRLLYTGWKKPYLSEAKFLKIPLCHATYIREVELLCQHQPLVIARTVIPRTTLTGPEKKLLCLGTKPLGEYIFTHPQYQRSNFQIAKVYLTSAEANPCWGRRSIFLLRNKPLLVTEVFTPYFCIPNTSEF